MSRTRAGIAASVWADTLCSISPLLLAQSNRVCSALKSAKRKDPASLVDLFFNLCKAVAHSRR